MLPLAHRQLNEALKEQLLPNVSIICTHALDCDGLTTDIVVHRICKSDTNESSFIYSTTFYKNVPWVNNLIVHVTIISEHNDSIGI
jgi:hypothetical protein